MRVRILAAGLFASLLVGLAVTATIASASTPAPPLALKLGSKGASVKVTWHFTTTAPQSQRVVEVERSTDDRTWSSVTKRVKAPKAASYTDKTPVTVTTTYRVRLDVAGDAGSWFSTTIEPLTAPTTAPPTTATPTTPPTSQGGNVTLPTPPAGQQACPNGTENYMLSLINGARGTTPVAREDHLDAGARERAIQTATRNNVSPVNFDTWDHTGWAGIVAGYGFHGSLIGENLGGHTQGTKAMFDWWMNSPVHHALIVNKSVNKVGIGCISTPYKVAGISMTTLWFALDGGYSSAS